MEEKFRITVTTGSVKKPAPFDGKMTWDACHTHADRAAYLAISLRESAATVLTNLPVPELCFCSAISVWYSPSDRTEQSEAFKCTTLPENTSK
jgi:hypothetical protein